MYIYVSMRCENSQIATIKCKYDEQFMHRLQDNSFSAIDVPSPSAKIMTM